MRPRSALSCARASREIGRLVEPFAATDQDLVGADHESSVPVPSQPAALSPRRAPARSRSGSRASARNSCLTRVLVDIRRLRSGTRRRPRAAAAPAPGSPRRGSDRPQSFIAMPPRQQLHESPPRSPRSSGGSRRSPANAFRRRSAAPRAPRPAPPRYRYSRSSPS